MVQYALTWAAAMSWHLWRIMTFRPAFKNLSDTNLMVFSFMVLYFGAGLLRWVVLGPNTGGSYLVLKTAFGLFLYMLVILATFERRYRNSSLSAVVLGASAATDLLVSAGYVLGVMSSVEWPVIGTVLKATWTMGMVAQFNRQPAEIRQKGYRWRAPTGWQSQPG